jgi:hypothetical protein
MKNRSPWTKDSKKTEKGTCKNSVIPLKDQTCESWALKEKRFKPNVYIIYSTK